MNKTIQIATLARFCAAFGTLGLQVGSRTDVGKRTQDDTEWYVVRRFLKEGLLAGVFKPPLSVRKVSPPEPDFVLEGSDGKTMALVEITEATDPADQREMTEFERSKQPAMLLGGLGGRFAGGASQPGRVWASDVLDAVARKEAKTICSSSAVERHLVIYPNSNASVLLFDNEGERDAFNYLDEVIAERRDELLRTVNGCLVHVLGKEHVCFDLLGKNQLVERVRRSNLPHP
jgi:hypothetical protein